MSRRRPRRSFVLVTVLVIVGIALFVATSFLFLAQAEVAGVSSSLDAVQSRALLRSGLRVVIAELDRQREGILDGDLPRLEDSYVLDENGSRLGVVRLLPVSMTGESIVSEASKLDLNSITAERLIATGFVEDAIAQAIVDHRAAMPGGLYTSVAQLLDVPGITPTMVYGPIEELTVMDDALGVERDIGERIKDRLSGGTPRGLADLLTVWSFEPALQRSGRLRINLNVPWSDELAGRIEERWDAGVAAGVKQIMQNGTTFDSDAKIFQVMRFFNVDPADWPDAVDTLTTEEGEFHFGRLDINTAPYEALLGLPTVTADQAASIVRLRDRVDPDERATIAWPAIAEVLTPEQYDDLGAMMTVRSWTYGVRLAVGTVAADDPEGPLDHPVIYEVVVDLCAPRARVAYLRDISLLQTAAMVAVAAGSRFEDDTFVPETDVAAGGSASSRAGDDAENATFPASLDDVINETSGFGDDPESSPADPPMSRRPDLLGPPSGEAAPPPASGAGVGRSRLGRWRRPVGASASVPAG
ncbi:MAG: helix-hairpin-helix domain-containing protein [Phycisphaerales bacterium]|nr:helix-hairpin-helix domain-containing protein [Phycisphaerales bacterium]